MEEGRKMKLSIHIKKQLRSFLLQVDLDCEDGVFALLGPSGCGKTELAKAIAEALFDDENAMIRFDMSEYQRQGDAIRLIGDPKTKSKGLLTEQVKRKPYSVLLFDEVEKGHREVHDLLLQVLDDGHLTDSSGRKISFKNTIVIQTTNVGSRKVISTVETKVSDVLIKRWKQS